MTGLRSLEPGHPDRIGAHRLTGILGSGGQGIVYLGESPEGHRVAVKLSQEPMERDPDVRRLFLKEVEAARRVAPFCTARVLDVGDFHGRPYIVSEYVPGPSLHELVADEGPRTGSGLQRLAIATLTALDAIHDAGVIHRDLKPSNVIMGPEGPVVIDFGIARAMDRATTHSGLMGTPSFMAPELFLNEPASPASDVFAWGATMVHAATGRQAFRGDTLPAVMHAIMTLEPDLSGVPDDLAGHLETCLAKDPGARPEVAELLTAFTRPAPRPMTRLDTPYPAQPSSPDEPEAPTELSIDGTPRSPTWSRVAMGVTALVTLAATVLVIVVGNRRPDPTPAWEDTRDDPVSALLVTASGGKTVVITGGERGSVIAADLEGHLISRTGAGHRGPVRALAAGALGAATVVVSGGQDGFVRVAGLDTGKSMKTVVTHRTAIRQVIAAFVGGRYVALSLDVTGTLRMTDMQTRAPVRNPLGELTDVDLMTRGELEARPVLITLRSDRSVRVHDLATGSETGGGAFWSGLPGTPTQLAYGRLDGKDVGVVGDEEGQLVVWDLKTGAHLNRLRTGVPLKDLSVGALKDGRQVALTLDDERELHVWDLRTGDELTDVTTGDAAGAELTLASGRALAVTFGPGGRVRSWDVEPET